MQGNYSCWKSICCLLNCKKCFSINKLFDYYGRQLKQKRKKLQLQLPQQQQEKGERKISEIKIKRQSLPTTNRCSCRLPLQFAVAASDTLLQIQIQHMHIGTYVERQSYCCCYCILTANANWLDKLLLLLLLLLLFNDRDRKMPPHFEAPLGIGCEKQRRRRCNACGLKYLIALYCGWMRRVLKIFTHKPHTHTLPHSVYFPCHTHTHTHTTVVGQLFIQLKLRCLSVCVFHTIFSLSVSTAAVVAIEAIRPKDIDALYMFYIYAAWNFSYSENYYNCIV